MKNNLFVLLFSCKHQGTPWYAKLTAIFVVAYAFSPVDLIPDFIPVLGYLDDLILVPLGIWVALKMIPEPVLRDCRAQAEAKGSAGKPRNWIAGAVILVIWLALTAWLGIFLYHRFN